MFTSGCCSLEEFFLGSVSRPRHHALKQLPKTHPVVFQVRLVLLRVCTSVSSSKSKRAAGIGQQQSYVVGREGLGLSPAIQKRKMEASAASWRARRSNRKKNMRQKKRTRDFGALTPPQNFAGKTRAQLADRAYYLETFPRWNHSYRYGEREQNRPFHTAAKLENTQARPTRQGAMSTPMKSTHILTRQKQASDSVSLFPSGLTK